MASNQREPDADAVEDDELQYGSDPSTRAELDAKYKNRPHNHSKTLPFHDLVLCLFNPLDENKKRPTGSTAARAKRGRRGPNNPSTHEMRYNIIHRFMSKWRYEVGNDFYPAMRLIIPDKDRDRPMYGLKEKAIGKLLVKVMKISPDSEDGSSLANWKRPSQGSAGQGAGNFALRCYEVLSKRAMRYNVGNMRIAEVNELLDKLAAAQGEAQQMPIFETFYERMNADELTWLIRIILRDMKLGASEKIILDIWHPDGEAVFNISSNLRRVCWDLTDPEQRLDDGEGGISLMSCFQPQLAQFTMNTFQKMLDRMNVTEEDPEFWIEEKLDGERMQMHMIEDESIPGGKRFAFWSRKATDYTYLYGSGFEDDNSALTRHLKDAFDPRVRNIILDGEMITWDPESDVIVPFGTLKTAALDQQKNPFSTGVRPLFRVFDCLYVNDQDITKFTLRDRHNALIGSVRDVHRRLEIHHHVVATSVNEIEPLLRKVVAEASEGLVLKNPRSLYRLNSRNDDWMKVKPEYMKQYGESLDCLILGGYYGSGHKGGRLSSFLCGLRVSKNMVDSQGVNPMKFYSFFKVGGGFRAEDYDKIMYLTTDKWIGWDRKNPPTEYIELGGSDGQLERPDVWIKPSDSVVVEVKAASVGPSDSFKTNFTLRFPRFKAIRSDKDWQSALAIDHFINLKAQVEAERQKEMEVDRRRKRSSKRVKRDLTIAGNDSKVKTPYGGPETKVFEGLNFCVLSEMIHPVRKTKAEIEQIIKSNGGSVFQSPTAKEDILCIGDKKVVRVASLIKSGHTDVIKPSWILDAVEQAEIDGPERERLLLPFEPNHMFHMTPTARETIAENVDIYGDSYARDVSAQELTRVLDDMIPVKNSSFSPTSFLSELEEHERGLGEMRGSIFRGCVAYFGGDVEGSMETRMMKLRFLFCGGLVAEELDEEVTHVVIADENRDVVRALRKQVSERRGKIPRVVGWAWLEDSWKEGTLLDEERFAVVV